MEMYKGDDSVCLIDHLWYILNINSMLNMTVEIKYDHCNSAALKWIHKGNGSTKVRAREKRRKANSGFKEGVFPALFKTKHIESTQHAVCVCLEYLRASDCAFQCVFCMSVSC